MCRNVVDSCMAMAFPHGTITPFPRRRTVSAHRFPSAAGFRPAERAPEGLGTLSGFPSRSENLAALARRQDAELLAVLRDRAPRDLDVLVAQQLDDLLVRVRVLRALRADD